MRRAAAIVILAAAAAAPAAAQTRWTDRARVAASAGVQLTRPLEQSVALEKYVEPALVTADARQSPFPLVEGGITVRVAGNIGVAGSLSYLTGSRDGRVNARMPHPFYFDSPRPVSGTVSDVHHAELAVHAGGVYMIVWKAVDISVGGGASFFRVSQDLVADVIVDEAFPYDTAAFVRAPVSRVTESAAGYHAGAEATWKLSPRWGIGVLARFARARVPLMVDDLDAGRARVGGVQVAAGVRWIIPSGAGR